MIRHHVKEKIVIELQRNFKINTYHDIIDVAATAAYNEGHNNIHIAFYKESLHEDFFDLKTRIAGEMLQKFINYNIKIAILGTFDNYSSKSLRDFIREANRTGDVMFLDGLETYLNMLAI